MPEDWSAPGAIASQATPSAALKTFLFLARFFSPYQLNPFNLNLLRDILAVLLEPCQRPETPATADEIWHRLNEISFSAAFFTELQGLVLAKQEADRSLFSWGRLERRLRRLNMHVIDSQELTSELGTLSKLDTQSAFITALRDEGRSRTDAWLGKNFQLIGVRSSFTLANHLD